MNTRIRSAALALAVSGLFAAQPALAGILDSNGYTNGSASASITSPISLTTNAGGLSMFDVSTSTTFEAWCADILGVLASSASYTLIPGATFYSSDPGKATGLSHLASNWLSSVAGNATNSAAFQLAVWEIVNETSGGSYSLTAGNFEATSSAAVLSAANLMLGDLSGSLTYTASVWGQNTPNTTQDVAVFAPIPPVAAVPEPEIFPLMLAGLGLMGFVGRRRNRSKNSPDPTRQ